MQRKFTRALLILVSGLAITGCKENKKSETKPTIIKESSDGLAEKEVSTPILVNKPEGIDIPDNMIWISGGEFMQGAVPQDKMAMDHEKPAVKVAVDGFFIDITEVTNAQFAKFVEETGYVTVAERAIDWEELKKQVPAGTEKPHDSILQPGALTFRKTKASLPNLYDFSQWWKWSIGANWRHPNGPKSNIIGKEDYPVVQVSYEDALAYCDWSKRRLPTEAEWELAARGGNYGTIFLWGDESAKLDEMANTWNGEFPVNNTKIDGFELRAPVKSYLPNKYGLYDMAGNVWEWTSDWYNTNYYKEVSSNGKMIRNPSGAETPFTPNNPYAKERVIKGGSFLCSASYCASYRVSARMGSSMDSSLEHLGFRTVASAAMLLKDD